MIGWIGNVFIVLGLYGIGDKRRNAFFFTIAGECCYIVHTFLNGDWAIFAAAWIFLAMAVRGYVKWGQE